MFKLYFVQHTLKAFSQGNVDFVTDMIKMFLEQTPQDLLSMEEALVQHNWEIVQDLAHQLKSTFGTLGMSIHQNTAKEIEYNMRQQKYHSNNQELIQSLKLYCSKVYPLLQQHIA